MFCLAYLLLALYSFLIYFRIAKPIGKGLDVTTLTRLGLPVSDRSKSGAPKRAPSTPGKTLLPLPAWALEQPSGATPVAPKSPSHGMLSPSGSSKVSMSARKSPKTSLSPTSPKGKTKSSSPSHGSPRDAFAWLTRTQTPTRLSSPLNYPKSLASPSSSASRTLSPNGSGSYTSSNAFPKAESPMLRRTGEGREAVIYATPSYASPSVARTPHDRGSPAQYYTPSSMPGGKRAIQTVSGGSPSQTLSSPAYASPRAVSNFSIENYTTNMSPLPSTGTGVGMREGGVAGGARFAPSGDFSFVDDTQLDEYVERQRRIETTKEYLNPENATGGASRSGFRPLKMPTYQSMAIRKSSDKPSSSKDGAYNDDGLALQLYKKEGVAPFMELWSENMRSWLSYCVLKPLTKWFDEVVEHMGKDALYQAQLSQVQSGVQKLQTQQANMFSVKPTLVGGASAAATAQSQQQQQQHLAQRMKLERLFGDFGSSREYVVERIRTLAQGAVLQSYNWCAGGKWKDKEWTTDLPTDAQIVCHLFCTHLDELVVPTDAAHLHDAFRSRYLVGKDESAKQPAFAIVQRSVNPPHYNIVVNKEEWNVLRGRNNLFDALCLFIYVVKKDYKGVLDQRYLGGSIGLLDVLSTDEE